MKKRLDLLLLLPLCALLAWWQWQYAGYVKDDTFISMRYARNLASGHGLVFNYGERLEGYTNFLWIILTVPAYWLGVDALNWVKAMGCLAGQAGIFVTWGIARFFAGDRSDGPAWAVAAVYATSCTVILWSMAGLEPPLMAVLCSGGVLYAMKVWEEREQPRLARRHAIISGLLLTGGALCRPDAHAVIIFAGVLAVADAIRQRKLPTPWLVWGAVILGLLIPYHAVRVTYFGELLPNTFYVKAAAGPEVMEAGLQFAKELITFTVNPGVFALALLGLLLVFVPGTQRRVPKLLAGAICIFFVLYLVKIGEDEMKWFRLYLPVLPLLMGLASDGLRQIGRGLDRLLPFQRSEAGGEAGGLRSLGVATTTLALIAAAVGMSISLTYAQDRAGWHSNYLRWSERSFMKMGQYIDKRSETGDVVVFQDMGAAPLNAPHQRWVDTIGILNHTVARELARIQLNPFMRGLKRKAPGGAAQIQEFDRRVRDYFFEQNPDWIAFVAYVAKPKRKEFGRKVRKTKGDWRAAEAMFKPAIRRNSHAHGIARDDRFDDYVYERYFRRHDGYWLVLYRHKDFQDKGKR